MNESGHSHKELPYEVRGDYALADTELWPFVQDVLRLEWSCFGTRLADYKSEVKGMKLLSKDRFEHAGQMAEIEAVKRQQLCRALLQAGLENRPPTREQLTAYGQASLGMADGIFDLLERHKAILFASVVPRGTAKPPAGAPPLPDILRKDHIFLLERFFYFLERQRQMGLLVMDEVEKTEDRRFVQRLHDYFVKTGPGRERSRWIVPSPFFVASDMALPVQVADVVIYALNWGYRHPAEMTAPTRPEIESRFGTRIESLKWKGEGYDGVRTYKSFGIVCVPDLYTPRK
ncbi:MAG TPA: DUF3800 domain-containing protein [Verrucomicrobiae bacterium]